MDFLRKGLILVCFFGYFQLVLVICGEEVGPEPVQPHTVRWMCCCLPLTVFQVCFFQNGNHQTSKIACNLLKTLTVPHTFAIKLINIKEPLFPTNACLVSSSCKREVDVLMFLYGVLNMGGRCGSPYAFLLCCAAQNRSTAAGRSRMRGVESERVFPFKGPRTARCRIWSSRLARCGVIKFTGQF